MHTVEGCVVGLTVRERAEAGAMFVPHTTRNAMPMANEATGVVACVLDMAAGEMVWADVAASQEMPVIEASGGPVGVVLRSLLRGTRMDVGRLLAMHAEARGRAAASADECDVAVGFDDLATDYAAAARWTDF